jgi:2-keto-4-pentenoate hydratase/2-oxohepta-3-ene-1,7-dioic acid hydratase in catechol pathway
MEIPDHPMVFIKASTSIQNPGDPIVLPRFLRSDKVDFEGELGVVIGRPCKNVTAQEALSYVLGYTCVNDVSARDWQKEKGGGQFCRGKSFDTFCPVGPCLATADEIPDPSKLTIRSFVNEEKMQESSLDDMIFDVPTLISFLSGSTTLLPGTLILTGTPSGVGEARNPKRFLVPGDEVTIEVDGVGILTNPVVEEVFGGDEVKQEEKKS